ncbi:MAG: DUF2254 domain-containing protein [Solirubrobacterales bacterium]
MSWRTRWRLSEYLRNSIWLVPGAFALVAYLLGRIEPDAAREADFPIQYSPEAARSVLSALAGGMITFTGFVFSILLLAVQFGSSQFSPRMLRRFLRDGTTKLALGVFIATFLFSLQELRWVGNAAEPDLVPNAGVNFAIFLLLASMFMFLRLIHRTTSRLRVASVLRELSRDGRRTIDRVYPDRAPSAAEPAPLPPPGDLATVAYEGAPAVLQSIDRRGLVRYAGRQGWAVELVPAVGDLVIEGDPLFRVAAEPSPAQRRKLRGMVAVGDERTMKQDPAFALRLLADISVKALSPGINDPSTAVQALDQIEALLRRLGGRRLTPGVGRDAGGAVRLRWPAPSWADYLDLALDETRQYGEGSVQVSRRMRALLVRLADRVPAYRRPAVEAKLALVGAGADRAFRDQLDQLAAATSDPQGIGTSREPA